MDRPSFQDLTLDEQLHFGNGVGPDWFPWWLRNFVTETASWFFQDASWRHHDFGYAVGGDRFDRARCDWKFLKAMLRDAWSQPKGQILQIPLALFISVFFYLMVRVFGRFGAFSYSEHYASIDVIRNKLQWNNDG